MPFALAPGLGAAVLSEECGAIEDTADEEELSSCSPELAGEPGSLSTALPSHSHAQSQEQLGCCCGFQAYMDFGFRIYEMEAPKLAHFLESRGVSGSPEVGMGRLPRKAELRVLEKLAQQPCSVACRKLLSWAQTWLRIAVEC
ncbi:hypothetical protein TREES_T100010720 [Tupaia chinensis]|uniref:Uncharacterized protein n=1 Tax=Tupaia chinensis TaxID=246437 RepID=L9KT03_TUPCH|nr:hypothetical protein TREES_T100010720 [Tupaia chinensis]